jgi:hypothetical protein
MRRWHPVRAPRDLGEHPGAHVPGLAVSAFGYYQRTKHGELATAVEDERSWAEPRAARGDYYADCRMRPVPRSVGYRHSLPGEAADAHVGHLTPEAARAAMAGHASGPAG